MLLHRFLKLCGLIAVACISSISFAQSIPEINPSQTTPVVYIPFVGCKADGQMGPVHAPTGDGHSVQLPAEIATKLAYYKSDYSLGVVAPRNWYCLATYGSSGSTLYVTPHPLDMTAVLSPSWKGLTGPAIQISILDGETSGRFEVARIIARAFPQRRSFVQSVINQGTSPANDFIFGPYATDKIISQNDMIVEYQTPANAHGLGTMSRMLPNKNPIDGFVMLRGTVPSGVQFAMRLPVNQQYLSHLLIKQSELDYSTDSSSE